jgi:Tfp pilus assembly protein PilF
MHHISPNRKNTWWPILAVAVVLLSGCASGRDFLTPEYRYGHPEYDHVSELPQNQAAAWKNDHSPADKPPEMTSDEYEILGDAMLKQKRFALAYLHYNNALSLKAGNRRIEYKICMTYLQAGKLDDALEQFRKLSETSPENAAVYEGMGQVYFSKGKYQTAEAYFIKALAMNDGLWRSHTFLGYIYDAQNAHQRAINQYMAALSIKPGLGSVYNNLGVSYSMGNRFPEAIEAFKTALAHHYTHKKVYNNLGLALAKNGQYAPALAAFEKGSGKPMAYTNLGLIHLGEGDFDQAIRCFEIAIELDPRFNARAKENLRIAQMEKSAASAH